MLRNSQGIFTTKTRRQNIKFRVFVVPFATCVTSAGNSNRADEQSSQE